MFRSRCRLAVFLCMLLMGTLTARGQTFRPEHYVQRLSAEALIYHIEYLSDSLLQGRETGTAGAVAACSYVSAKFRQSGLLPFQTERPIVSKPSYIQGFTFGQQKRGRNVIGYIPATVPGSRNYIVVSAHYDHLGIMYGVRYPGADSNASGVSVLLTLAHLFSQAKQEGVPISHHLIFVAYDAKEYSMEGARFFAQSLSIPPEQISLNINIDQIGTALAPPSRSQNYVLVLGASQVPPHIVRSLNNSNLYYNIGLEIDYSFYNSPAFADIYFSMTEQTWLAQKNVPSLLITSGVNSHTYKPTDTPAVIDVQVLKKRTEWLFFTLWDLVQRL